MMYQLDIAWIYMFKILLNQTLNFIINELIGYHLATKAFINFSPDETLLK